MLLRGTSSEQLQFAFLLYDTNGDGAISRQEFSAIIEGQAKAQGMVLGEAMLNRLVETMFPKHGIEEDGDDDDAIEFEEARDFCSYPT